MNSQTIWELIGYLGSVLVLVSLLMNSIIKLRIINALGSLIFCVYAFKINSIPTALMNAALVGIDMFFLYKLIVTKKSFSIVEASTEDSSVKYILNSYKDDIQKFFDVEGFYESDKVFVVYDGETIAGVSSGKVCGNSFEFTLDYSTPKYRDCSVGTFICERLSESFSELRIRNVKDTHIAYLNKLGYIEKDGVYTKKFN